MKNKTQTLACPQASSTRASGPLRKKHRMSSAAVAVSAVLASGQVASAATLYYESFTESSYPTDFLGSAPDSGGGDWTSAQNNSLDQIVDGSIDTTGTQALTATGGKLDFSASTDNRTRSTLSAGVGANGTTKYASFLIDIDDDGGTGGFDGLEFKDSGGTIFRIGWLGNVYGVHNSLGAVSGSGVMSAGLNFVVAEFNFGAGNSDTVDLYFNPTAAALSAGTSSAQLATADYSFDIFEIVQYHTDPLDGFIDEIRVGDTLADVALIPEPTSFVLAALGLLGLIGRRRR